MRTAHANWRERRTFAPRSAVNDIVIVIGSTNGGIINSSRVAGPPAPRIQDGSRQDWRHKRRAQIGSQASYIGDTTVKYRTSEKKK